MDLSPRSVIYVMPLLKQKLKDHIEAVHKGKKLFICNICYKSFSQNISLKRHIASVHEEVKQFRCDSCKSIFAQIGELKRHILTVHEKRSPTNVAFVIKLTVTEED
jgi:uncharacterized Zn-finger protein